jgi:hypothetical protein
MRTARCEIGGNKTDLKECSEDTLFKFDASSWKMKQRLGKDK